MAEEETENLSLHKVIAAKIQEGNASILERAAAKIAEETLEKRVSLVYQAYTAIDKEEKEHKKLHPDTVTYDVAGGVSKVFSKDRWEQRKKLEEKITKLKKHLEAALADPSKFSELANLVNQK